MIVDHKDGYIEKQGFEISIFRNGTPLNEFDEKSKKEIFDILTGSYGMPIQLLNHMFKQMKKENWTIERFNAAYEHVLNTHVWNTPPKPASFLSFDKKVKFNVYSEISHKISYYIAVYCKPYTGPLYVTKEEQQKFKVPLWDEKYRVKNKISEQRAKEMAEKQDEYIKNMK